MTTELTGVGQGRELGGSGIDRLTLSGFCISSSKPRVAIPSAVFRKIQALLLAIVSVTHPHLSADALVMAIAYPS